MLGSCADVSSRTEVSRSHLPEAIPADRFQQVKVACHAPYLRRIPSRNVLLCAVTSQACGQKHRSTHHQSLGTPAWFSAGNSRSKSSLPVPKGLCVLVLCSLSVPSESMTWTWVILPRNFSSNSSSPPSRVSFCPVWLA